MKSRKLLFDQKPCSPEESAQIDEWIKDQKRRFNNIEAQKQLACYAIDGDPKHILRAVRTVAEFGDPLPPVMVGHLRQAIRLLEKPQARTGRPPLKTVRNQRIAQAVYTAYRTIPELDEIADHIVENILRAEGITRGAFNQVLRRARKRLVERPTPRPLLHPHKRSL